MPKNVLTFVDTSELVLPERLNVDAVNFASDVIRDSRGKAALSVSIRATHSGQLIPGRCYTGVGMKATYKEWFSVKDGGESQYGLPVIMNHDIMSEPLGRVKEAAFTQLKFGSKWEDDWVRPDTGKQLGSGYVTLDAHITDEAAIPKVIDGRLNTVSVGMQPEVAWCSVCRTSVADSEGCEHKIGSYVQLEDGNEYLVYMVTGKLHPFEVSYVNRPRQQNAVTLSFRELKDHLTRDSLVVERGVSLGYLGMGMVMDGESVNLLGDSLPASGKLSGKTQVSMAPTKIDGAPVPPATPAVESKVQDATPEAKKAPSVRKDVTDLADAVKVIRDGGDANGYGNFDFCLAHLLRVVGGVEALDFEINLKDAAYLFGITDNNDGHAHVFDGSLSFKTKVFQGSTYRTGQGQPEAEHQHSIWVELADDPAQMLGGETRDASAGPSHTHDFSAPIPEYTDSADTLVVSRESADLALATLDEVLNRNLLTDAHKAAISSGSSKAFDFEWTEEYLGVARKILPRIRDAKTRATILGRLATAGHLKAAQDMAHSETIEKALKNLNDQIDQLRVELTAEKAKVAELTKAKDEAVAEHTKKLADSAADFTKTMDAAKAALDAALDGKAPSVPDGVVLPESMKTVLASIPAKIKSGASAVAAKPAAGSPTALNDNTNQGTPAKKPRAPSLASLADIADQVEF